MIQDLDAFRLEAHSISLRSAELIEDVQGDLRANLPNRRVAIFDVLLKEELTRAPTRFLELGVFQASNIRYAMEHYPLIQAYTGVDDYGLGGDSPYISPTSYWKDQAEADQQYEKSNAIFKHYDQRLFRMTSDEFLTIAKKHDPYDIIFVDGNHKYAFALNDMKNYFELVREGGILLVDDYDNADVPDVTRAVVKFVEEHLTAIDSIRWVSLPFVNSRKVVPVSLSILAIQKSAEAPNP